MFYSETLLSKTGPLARVWLSSNLERKVPKSQILQQNIEDTVDTIVSQDQAPLALRLTGQLLLGVVRIYSRKARYLLDDCNDALMKIKMAFRPGNVDLPANMLSANTAEKHILTDTVTGIDLRLPADPDILFADLAGPTTSSGTVKNPHNARRQDITLDDGDFLVNPSQLDIGRGATQLGIQNGAGMDLDEGLGLQDDLGLDIGDDDGFGFDLEDAAGDSTIQIGRDAPVVEEDLVSRDGDGDTTMKMGIDDNTEISRGGDDGFGFLGGDDDDTGMLLQPDAAPLPEENGTTLPPDADKENEGGIRDDESQLTDVDELEKALDVSEFQPLPIPGENEEEEEEEAAAPKREPKRRKVIIDKTTEIRGKNLKAQQDDRTNILRDPTYLPRDPTMLTLTLMQKTGGFASSVFYPKNIHPDLAKLVDPDFIKEVAEKKRKRALGLEAPDAGDGPSLHIPDDEDCFIHQQQQDETIRPDIDEGEQVHIPGDDFDAPLGMGDSVDNSFSAQLGGGHDSTTVGREGSITPIPEDSGLPQPEVVSQATTHAVHLLREQFEEPTGRSGLTKAEVVFQDLFPKERTTKADATKMFFEVLVLATKDAVMVRQDHVKDEGRIRVKGKKALWGAWAEHGGDEKEGEMGGVAVGIQPVQASA